jgi:hypothetical protein
MSLVDTRTDPPEESTYSSAVSRDSVRIVLTIAALNDMNVILADVRNPYLNAPTREGMTKASLEFVNGDFCGVSDSNRGNKSRFLRPTFQMKAGNIS